MGKFWKVYKQAACLFSTLELTLKVDLFFRGDLDAIKRITVEFCEDAFNNGILYVEARFCPHLMLSDKNPEVTAKDVVETVLVGFKEGEAKFGLKVRIYKNILH